MTDPFPDEIDQTLWDEACRRADAIRNFLKRHPEGTTSRDVAELATDLGLSQATAYRLIKMFAAAELSCRWLTVNVGAQRGTASWTISESKSSAPQSARTT